MDKYQRVLDTANELYKAMADYEAHLLARPDANATRLAGDFAKTRAHIQKLLAVAPQVQQPQPPVETQAVKAEAIEQSAPVRQVARKGRR